MQVTMGVFTVGVVAVAVAVAVLVACNVQVKLPELTPQRSATRGHYASKSKEKHMGRAPLRGGGSLLPRSGSPNSIVPPSLK